MQIGAVVVGVVVRSHSRSPIILPSAEDSRRVERIYLRTILSAECNMCFDSLFRPDKPKVRDFVVWHSIGLGSSPTILSPNS